MAQLLYFSQYEWSAPGTTWFLRGPEQNGNKFKHLPHAHISQNMAEPVNTSYLSSSNVRHCLWIQMHSFPQALEALQVLRLGIQLTRLLIICRFLMVTFEEPAILN